MIRSFPNSHRSSQMSATMIERLKRRSISRNRYWLVIRKFMTNIN